MSSPRPTFSEHEFYKAKASDPHRDCVRVAQRDGWVEIRDDKTTFGAPNDHRLQLTDTQFAAFLHSITHGNLGS